MVKTTSTASTSRLGASKSPKTMDSKNFEQSESGHLKAEEFLRLLEDKNIGSFQNFSSIFKQRLKLGSWRTYQQSGLICFYQLNKGVGFRDLSFQTRIMINQKLNMEIIQGENELESKNIPLKSFYQFQKTLDFYEKQPAEPESAQVNLKKASLFLNCIKETDLTSIKNLQLQHVKTELRDMLQDNDEESDEEMDVKTKDVAVETAFDPADYLKVEVQSDNDEVMMLVPAENPINFVFCGVKEEIATTLILPKSPSPEPPIPPILHTANKQVIFACEQCDKRFPSQPSLRHHQLSHPLKQPDKCSSCDETFYDKRLFQQHKVICCPKPTEFFCEYCAKSFKSLYVLQDHLLRHQPDKKEKCTQCNKYFLPGNDMNKHIKRHLNLREHHCHICERTFTQAVALRDHYESHSNVKVRCPKCNKAFATTLNMKNHLRTRCDGIFKNDSDIPEPTPRKITFLHHKYTYSCFVEACDRKFPLKKLLKEHLLKEHNVEIPNFERYCLECKQEFESDNIYYSHVKTHLCVHTCKLCGKGFRTEETLGRHELTHATSMAERPFACDQCNLKFKTDSNLRSHKQTKHTKRQFGCKICGQRFVFCRQVENHTRVVHANQAIYNCNVCNEQFKYIRAFKSHMFLRHNIKEVYWCDTENCNSKFTQANELRAHKHESHGETYHGKKKETLPTAEENYVVQENVEIQQYDIISYQET